MDKKILFYSFSDKLHTIAQEMIKHPPDGYSYVMPADRSNQHRVESLKKNKLIRAIYKNILYPFMNPLSFYEKDLKVASDIDLVYVSDFLINKKVPWVCDCEVALSLSGHNDYLLNKNRRKIEDVLASSYCRKIMPFTNFGKKTIEREFDTSRFQHKIEVVHFAADVPIIRRKKHDRYINIIFVGTANQSDPVIFNMKGGREAISAFRIISKKYPNVRMKIISNIPQGIDTKIERLEVISLMPRKELFKIYAESDILLAPTYLNLGMSFVEAMGCSLPIITTDMFGLPEAVKDNGFVIHLPVKGKYEYQSTPLSEFPSFTDFIYKNNSKSIITGIVEAVSLVAEHPYLITKMSSASRERYEKEFSVEYKNAKLKRIFDEATLQRKETAVY
ncbi:glycosyltransferase [Candidatus Pacearchaeota archaeon]|nr:glycosyltransferase [Candidatus Pacearchaeota archaeon]